jgi:hypothetical protein
MTSSMMTETSSAPLPKFVHRCCAIGQELRTQMGTGKLVFPVPRFDLKFLCDFAAAAAGTSSRRH